jgi:ABC-type uncharacterized transport system fused permease/ATPase subunit
MFKIEQLFDTKLVNDEKYNKRIEFKIRGLMVQKLIELSKFCSIPAYKKIFENQQLNIKQHNIEQENINNHNNNQQNINQININHQQNDEEEEEEENADIIEEEEKNATNYLASENKLTFDKLPSGFILFCADNFTVRVITNSNNLNEEERKTFENLYSTQVYNKDKNKKGSLLPDYKKFTHEDYLKELRTYFGINDKYMLDIPEGYVFTPDNYFKMVMINIKITAGIPVILMGETGCGKTFLIRMMSQIYSKKNIKKVDEEKYKNKEEILKIKNIHAGITEEDIIKFMNENVINKANEIKKKMKKFGFSLTK